MEKLVSIIVPVYNVEKYLDQCVNSLINQTWQRVFNACLRHRFVIGLYVLGEIALLK